MEAEIDGWRPLDIARCYDLQPLKFIGADLDPDRSMTASDTLNTLTDHNAGEAAEKLHSKARSWHIDTFGQPASPRRISSHERKYSESK